MRHSSIMSNPLLVIHNPLLAGDYSHTTITYHGCCWVNFLVEHDEQTKEGKRCLRENGYKEFFTMNFSRSRETRLFFSSSTHEPSEVPGRFIKNIEFRWTEHHRHSKRSSSVNDDEAGKVERRQQSVHEGKRPITYKQSRRTWDLVPVERLIASVERFMSTRAHTYCPSDSAGMKVRRSRRTDGATCLGFRYSTDHPSGGSLALPGQ